MTQEASGAKRKHSRNVPEPWRDPVLGPCACSQLRRTSRAVSALYDSFLAPAGLTVTQYALLVTIARGSAVTKTSLAERLGMDRTTLTRNLRPLERDGLVRSKAGADRREHLVELTGKGLNGLEAGYACWKQAQERFVSIFGDSSLKDLNQLLKRASESATLADDPQSELPA